jgi:Fe-S cluster assembly protein SufD
MLSSDPISFRPDAATLATVLAELEELGPASGGAVPADVRRAALAAYAAFGAEGVPHSPRWRHDYARTRFEELVWSTGRIRVPARLPARERDDAGNDRPALADANAGGVVHTGSTYLEPASRLGDSRVVLASLGDARRTAGQRVGAVQRHIVAPGEDRFAALATAFQNCGAYVDIPSGVTLDAPLQLVWAAQPGAVRAVFPHTLIRLGAGARATIVERHVGDTEALVCGIVEVELGAGAELDYAVVQQADDGSRLYIRRAARCAAGARIGWHVAELGGALTRTSLGARLTGAGGTAETNAFFFARAFGHADLAIEVQHESTQTASQATVRAAVADRAQGRIAGAVRIAQHAPHCVAKMRADGLVLSRDAYLDALPLLQVATSDVAASHTASVGSLDEEQLFYVQSRGIARSAAARMIALAFFEPAIERFPQSELREEVRTALDECLDDVPDTFVS